MTTLTINLKCIVSARFKQIEILGSNSRENIKKNIDNLDKNNIINVLIVFSVNAIKSRYF